LQSKTKTWPQWESSIFSSKIQSSSCRDSSNTWLSYVFLFPCTRGFFI
jgi:hypothetical protein